jgi:predicted nucleic acid-binding protein
LLTIDASVWVAADAADEPARGEARDLLRVILEAGLPIRQPLLSVVEVVAAVARRTHDPRLARDAGRRVLEAPGLTFAAFDLQATAEASALAGEMLLRAADAVYAATALRHGTQLITLDRELRERAVPVVDCFTPPEWLARDSSPA